jgi:hypothetical protein
MMVGASLVLAACANPWTERAVQSCRSQYVSGTPESARSDQECRAAISPPPPGTDHSQTTSGGAGAEVELDLAVPTWRCSVGDESQIVRAVDLQGAHVVCVASNQEQSTPDFCQCSPAPDARD